MVKIISFLVVFYLIAGDVLGQKRKKRPPKFKKNRKMAVICPIFDPDEYPYQGIGVKVGDPVAITYKLYVTRKFAISFDGGSAVFFLYDKYHRDNFTNFEEFDTLSYMNHKVNKDIVIQARALIHSQALDANLSGMDVYFGAGWQFRNHEVEYEFLDSGTGQQGRRTISEFSSGPEIVLGIEYAYFEIPLSAFAEVNLFKNLGIDNSNPRIQGGIGIRFVF